MGSGGGRSLSVSAEFDEFVPAGPVREFHAELQATYYTAEPERLRYIEHPGVGHRFTPELNEATCREVVAWFERWLVP